MKFQHIVGVLSLIVLALGVPFDTSKGFRLSSRDGPVYDTAKYASKKTWNFPSYSHDFSGGQFGQYFHRPGNGKNLDFSVHSCHNNGRMHDHSSGWNVMRDVPCACPIGKNIFWFFDDTFAYDKKGKFLGAASNSVSTARDPYSPSSITDISVTIEGKVGVAIPWTTEEAEIQFNEELRWVLWAFAPCIPLDDKHAAHMWTLSKFHSKKGYNHHGYSMAEYALDDLTGHMNITRKDVIDVGLQTYAYGNFASVIFGEHVYLYALDIQNSARYDIHLARAPRVSFYDKTTWSYWDNGKGSWTYKIPDGTIRNKKKAVISGKAPFSTGSIFWSDYHNSYLCVFFNNWADSSFYLISAPSPVGPWNLKRNMIHKTKSGSNGFNYGGQATPSFYPGHGEMGKKLVLSYTYNIGGKWYPTTDTLTFK
ncbi:hypothetical protein V1512DRAFT_65632 [Lipomyces arxii]|uniref:uncharacterized protein n=1 Tax=Lipomyces arxii TaxID=56418 RepID=UPI0034CEED26